MRIVHIDLLKQKTRNKIYRNERKFWMYFLNTTRFKSLDLVFWLHPISLLSCFPNHFQFFFIFNDPSSNKIVIFFSIYARFTSFKLRFITHTTTSHSADVIHQSNLFVPTHRINLHGQIFVFCTTLCHLSVLSIDHIML